MRKMPCVFRRQFTGPGSFVLIPEPSPGCEWVLDGEGVATRKWDGTAVMVKDGYPYARYDAKKGKKPPEGAIPCDPEPDPITGHWPHWVLVTNPPQPQFKYVREAADNFADMWAFDCLVNSGATKSVVPDGTYEACGPRINANRDDLPDHSLRRHGEPTYPDAPRDFEGLKAYLAQLNAEGIVFHHPDGRMAKLRRRDFGFEWPIRSAGGAK